MTKQEYNVEIFDEVPLPTLFFKHLLSFSILFTALDC